MVELPLPQQIAWEKQYSDNSGVEFALRFDATDTPRQAAGPTITIAQECESVELPLRELDWLLECLVQIRDIRDKARQVTETDQ